jgi:aspartate/methionine/tyrosine aminotransferase
MTAVRDIGRPRQSEYMYWAKTSSQARFNLATSGLENVLFKDLSVDLDELEITTTHGYGYPPLIKALSDRYAVDPANIVTAAGTSFANHLAMAAVINPGDEVLLERPAYEPLLALAHYLGANVQRFERRWEDGFQLPLEEIKRRVGPTTRLILITNFHNPSGVYTDEAALQELGEIARHANARVLVDEVYLEMLFRPAPPTAFHLGQHFIVTSSLTKAYGLSGLRCGWIFAAPDLVQRMWRLNDLFAASPVHAGERLSVAALRQLDELAERARPRLDRNRELLNKFLDSREDLEAVRPTSGSIMFPRVKGKEAESLFSLLREKYETSVVPGRFFEMPSHFRVGLGGNSDQLEEGLQRLGAALTNLES